MTETYVAQALIAPDAGVRLIEETFGGECSRREIERVRGVTEREGASVVVGLGGGKAMDILVDRNPDLVLVDSQVAVEEYAQ
jgi:glycerol dehydrogenase-like iron-containing ADH family enzyme